ncbi:hypothetical protein [Kitasatospora cathayae]|uniref:Uncharacterized protein n=1 Tax=Kitasatospora cathayae TaxID=3004092 RepID=A0ABY7QHF6_9ACTN|nr:hypothetical protein [Kitasatospora sp. HUAS 3-15]WBP91972.1 hypothetical protein O1G21_39975 [Kitasatospora sp. HUAS 3-15]
MPVVPGQRSAGSWEECPLPDAAETMFVSPAGQVDDVSLWEAPVEEPYDDEYGQDWPESDLAEVDRVWEAAAEEAGPVVPGRRSAAPVESAPGPSEPASGSRPVLAPLTLTEVMRSRLRSAVRALLAEPGLAGAPDPVRLAAVVLMSRTPKETGSVVIRKAELGRWLGLSAGRMKAVVRQLRASGAVSVETFKGDGDDDQALECRVSALLAAQGVAGHSLNLTKKEFAVLHGLVEALFAPGWAHRDGRVTEGGPLAGRTGRGAATDRLGALLLVLDANEHGRVRLCGGKVDTEIGRPAVTLARMLGCAPAGAVPVLARLAEAGLVERPRRGASGLLSRSRLMLPAVAAAHRAVPAEQAASVHREAARKTAPGSVSGLDVTTPPVGAPVTEQKPQVSDTKEAVEAEVSDLDDTTPIHTSHSPVADVVGEVAVDGGFSGEAAVGVTHRRPERAGAREEHARPASAAPAGAPLTVSGGAGGPLRGDKPNPHVITHHDHDQEHDQEQAVSARQSRRRAAVPQPPQDLVQVLAPVECLWARLDRAWLRRRIVAAVRAELDRIGAWTGSGNAHAALADRLTFRLRDQDGSALITDPLGWLLAKGLPQRRECAHLACDDGIRLDTGTACTICEQRITDRRSTRQALVREAVAQLPDATTDAERRSVIDQQLHRHAMLRAEQQVAARQRAEQQRAEATTRRAVREAQAKAAEAARQALPCEDCGTENAAGLCAGCWNVRATRTAIRECVDLALAGSADLADREDVNALVAHVRGELRAEMLRNRPVGTDLSGIRASDLLTAQNAAAEYRASALVLLARSPLADAEAEMAHDAAMRSAHRHPTRHAARAAANEAVEQARRNTALHLLVQRLEAVQALRARADQIRAAAAAPAREAVNA